MKKKISSASASSSGCDAARRFVRWSLGFVGAAGPGLLIIVMAVGGRQLLWRLLRGRDRGSSTKNHCFRERSKAINFTVTARYYWLPLSSTSFFSLFHLNKWNFSVTTTS
jgi:hypothetical protein